LPNLSPCTLASSFLNTSVLFLPPCIQYKCLRSNRHQPIFINQLNSLSKNGRIGSGLVSASLAVFVLFCVDLGWSRLVSAALAAFASRYLKGPCSFQAKALKLKMHDPSSADLSRASSVWEVLGTSFPVFLPADQQHDK
jgi:hypothetical protein